MVRDVGIKDFCVWALQEFIIMAIFFIIDYPIGLQEHTGGI